MTPRRQAPGSSPRPTGPPPGAPTPAAPPPPTAALVRAAEAVGDRWSLLVVARLLDGPARFGELLGALDGLAPNILARRLARLEDEGLVVGEPYSTRPVRHAYRLTAAGADLGGTVRMLAGWGAARGGDDDHPGPRHGACGSPLDVRWYCPTCAVVVDGAAASAPGGTGGPDPSRGDGLLWL